MPTVNDLKSSKFLTKHDVEPPILVTIKNWEKLNVAMENQKPEMKFCLYFNELEKPLVLNKTNGMSIATIAKSDDFDHWVGKEIVLYNDKNVMFAGQLTGGIRVRASKGGEPNSEYENEPHPDIQNQVVQESKFCGDCGKPKGECKCLPF